MYKSKRIPIILSTKYFRLIVRVKLWLMSLIFLIQNYAFFVKITQNSFLVSYFYLAKMFSIDLEITGT